MTTQSVSFKTLQSEVNRFERKARLGTSLELGCCALLAGAVLWAYAQKPEPGLLALAETLGLLAAVAIVATVLIVAKRKKQPQWTLAEQMARKIKSLKTQIALCQNVALWYLLPLGLATGFGFYVSMTERTGGSIPDARTWAYWAGTLVFYAGIYGFNRYVARTQLQPMLDRLVKVKEEMER